MSEEQILWDYLNRYLDEPTAIRAWLIWIGLRGCVMPNACAVGPDHMIYSWDKIEHHFEIELLPGNVTEYFYMNRITDEAWDW